jgi:hypothetical protein
MKHELPQSRKKRSSGLRPTIAIEAVVVVLVLVLVLWGRDDNWRVAMIFERVQIKGSVLSIDIKGSVLSIDKYSIIGTFLLMARKLRIHKRGRS